MKNKKVVKLKYEINEYKMELSTTIQLSTLIFSMMLYGILLNVLIKEGDWFGIIFFSIWLVILMKVFLKVIENIINVKLFQNSMDNMIRLKKLTDEILNGEDKNDYRKE